jgi:hypothetical protein
MQKETSGEVVHVEPLWWGKSSGLVQIGAEAELNVATPEKLTNPDVSFRLPNVFARMRGRHRQ